MIRNGVFRFERNNDIEPYNPQDDGKVCKRFEPIEILRNGYKSGLTLNSINKCFYELDILGDSRNKGILPPISPCRTIYPKIQDNIVIIKVFSIMLDNRYDISDIITDIEVESEDPCYIIIDEIKIPMLYYGGKYTACNSYLSENTGIPTCAIQYSKIKIESETNILSCKYISHFIDVKKRTFLYRNPFIYNINCEVVQAIAGMTKKI